MATNTKQRVTLFLHPDLLTQSKVQAIVEGITLTSLVEFALVQYLPKVTVINKPDIIKKK
ncbi:hypothetical protein CO112_00385 [Candidatus Dojkabacteria bacterium CG_4_9_14_3_um_filter_150_Dojkabacteria_WS6_41_13]|uniref:Uncharacterized protein n=1 Tax=Candidatus Dojkabacteria bacterium CG_4_10_14_0_2_um_filter_Dojkabacteria_WS6_41_15 TaxID=2014249 RepID=A0A2M7W161_9BACT|nr:MAG: hypothetical protein COZ14_00830 [Candidatus Dojkabacteria bacterium CG_4_10_14_3_um_filter_Dojkabacteria_WS6_41_9]PJA12911.1 MAG: hypothetical protein COX64_03905 [Candidatus Dojkabacteria bacterium CG_4_10_14_0_2_um_filter_Dojkabacteria_WS6_41_15]PJB23739.1 MAG: hypothetical protein CO112_00385 [Candidatus Dojkabacteria bacterium CG_4_9_14_3_um_filter_150_Dojkabacteria_WS6_41_13]